MWWLPINKHFEYSLCFFTLLKMLLLVITWWAMRDLNLRPRHYQWRALTSWANRPYSAFCQRELSKNIQKLSLVEIQGLEPWTPCLQSRCSSQLSYIPRFLTNTITSIYYLLIKCKSFFLLIKIANLSKGYLVLTI